MSLQSQFRAFTSKCYAEQAKAFLNAYWKEVEDKAEDVWDWTNKFAELDVEKEKEGCDVDEFTAHRFLESLSETMTVKQMRVALTEADLDFNKRIALLEYCLWKFGKSVTDFVARPKGDPEQIRQAEEMLAAVQKLVEEAQAKAQEAKARAEEAKERANEAKARADEAKQKENEADEAAAPFRAAEAELATALAELQAQEDAYNNKKEALKKKSEEGGVVSRGRAKADLAQLLAEDPLPLRTAKITTEAARKRAEKAKEPFEVAHAKAIAAREAADAAAQAADEARQAADDAADAADAAVDEAREKFKEAEVKFQELKDAGAGAGNIWWMEREVTEMKKYMPLKKGGIAKK